MYDEQNKNRKKAQQKHSREDMKKSFLLFGLSTEQLQINF